MIGTDLLANQIFIHSDGNATHNRAAMLHAGHVLCDFGGVECVICGNVESDGNTATDALMRPMGGDLVKLGVGFHSEVLLAFF